MKYLVLLCDGMSDYPIDKLNNRTPMQAAKKPYMNRLAASSELGLAKTVPDRMKPGSDIANLSVLGYNPEHYYSGRSPLEAVSIGIDMKPNDVSFRCNLVTLSDEKCYHDKTMLDYCADDISSAEAAILIEHINANLGTERLNFYNGVSYRHLLIWAHGSLDVANLTAPHDILDKKIAPYMDINASNKQLYEFMEKSFNLLESHPVNLERIKTGKRPANSIWLWGEGKRRDLPDFKKKFGLSGAMISAVDLLKGIGKLTGLNVINVKGATGYLDTNFEGKANAAIAALKSDTDLVYLHIEAPDECGHRGEIEGKVKAVELIDEMVLKPVLDAFEGGQIKILICPDHPTPLSLRTHTAEPVPYLIYDSTKPQKGASVFTEETAEATGNFIAEGHTLMEKFIEV